MAGGLLQLVAYGAQDQFLTGDPVITFFKAIYRHHTNFSMESIAQTANGTIGNNNKVSFVIARNGDLITDCWLEFKFNGSVPENNLSSVIKTVELEIGGQRVDRHTGDWLKIWSELSHSSSSRQSAYDKMTGEKTEGSNISTFYLPLQFFFCRNPGLALPLIALQYHEVKIIIEFESSDSIDLSDVQTNLYANYVYLDVDERRRFAQTSHQLLIEQIQYSYDSMSSSVRINFNHPVKELIWTVTNKNKYGTDSYTRVDSSTKVAKGFDSAQLKLNNQDRFSLRPEEYFRFVQPYQYHSSVPSIKHPIYVYSFALKPEEHQPSGTCNFSRIDNAYLMFENPNNNLSTIKLFAVNYNVLRITSGMGGLAFSN